MHDEANRFIDMSATMRELELATAAAKGALKRGDRRQYFDRIEAIEVYALSQGWTTVAERAHDARDSFYAH